METNWACRTCTFLNEQPERCEMCGTGRTIPTAKVQKTISSFFGSGSTPKRQRTLQPTVNKSDIRKEVLVGTRLLADCPMTFHTESSESSISTSTSTSTSTTTLSPFKPAKLAVACEQFDPMDLVECDIDIDNVPPGGWPKGASPPYLQVAAALDEVIATRSRIMKDNILTNV